MSAGRNLRSEDHFLCSICLEVLTDPVGTPCGHNFCKACITQYWNVTPSSKCPFCKKMFKYRPELEVNTFIKEMVAQFRHEDSSISSSEQEAAKLGEVPCDVCTGTRLKAMKSCLVCLASYCETHLEPHLTASRLKIHQLVDPVDNLEDRMCSKHNKPLELFCSTDQTCVCLACPVLDHKTHEFVSLKEEYERKMAELGKTEADVWWMIQVRQMRILDITRSVWISRDAADREKAEGVQVFTYLKESVERSLNELIKEITNKQKATEKRAEELIKDLEQEISILMKRSSEIKQLLCSEDHFHLLQSFRSLKAAPLTNDRRQVRMYPPLYGGSVMRAVAQLEENLGKKVKSLMQLKKIRQFAVDVTLDPDTAHPNLNLSIDRKQVNQDGVRRNLPDKPERFSQSPNVLGKQSFSSGRFYFEVQIKGKTNLALGVARSSINRMKDIILSPEEGYWTLLLRNGNQYKARSDPPVDLHLESDPEKLGVFVDYEEGLVSFYDARTATLIYSFTGCSFSGKLYPFFSPFDNHGGKNSAPLIICPVNKPV